MLNFNLVQFLSVHSMWLVIWQGQTEVYGIFVALRVRCEYANCYENKWAHNYASTQSQYTTLHGYLIECGLVHLIWMDSTVPTDIVSVNGRE